MRSGFKVRKAVKTSGKFRTVLVAVATIAATLAVSITTGVGAAHADTRNGQVNRLGYNLFGSPDNSAGDGYRNMLNYLRLATGHNYRDGVYENQRDRGGLIQLHIHAGEADMSLWFNPQDLYVIGFTNRDNTTYVFRDTSVDTIYAIRDAMGAGSRVLPLAFEGSYTSLSQAAGRGRGEMTVGYSDLWNGVHNLAWATPPNDQQNVARSLMLMIQYTSEAARFNSIANFLAGLMTWDNRNAPPSDRHLSGALQDVENNWAAISQFGYQISQDPTTQWREFPGAGRLYTWADVARVLALMLASYTLPGHTGGGSQQ
jgi:hypothetical protein